MSQKRKHAEDLGASANVQGSSKKARSNFKAGGSNFKAGNHPKPQPKANATSGIKSRIRDLKRLLEHVDNQPKYRMPAGIRVERERELETLEHELVEKSTAGREAVFKNKMISKYHQVRFFDRRRAERTLKKLRRQLSTLEDETERPGLLQKIHNAEVDLNYAMYHPLLEPYASLYPKGEKGEKDTTSNETHATLPTETDGPKGNKDMWRAIEEAMESNTLNTLRNRKPKKAAIANSKESNKRTDKSNTDKKAKPTTKSKATNDTNDTIVEDDGEESDGGFFE
ncbi:hypothetical protein BU24DRAFT_445766 [Aaosphaeria arxii CBS 175.79]|uniref:rRNA-processing protein EFG1 n=1 Tax=Aaosphaeria arxii CBS 175.79 TaxID=1450172 RepID=A0A6A5Y6A7_9PLEO|nr:uncharacterized protein BU24DRAFT_445766 [Aaosphaeria arxii CBS 175.79]KAF2020567.1 hypothetical protein BU24DRAFT_445766 [Aaosphaeria arxii CBS 175.79]